MEPSNRLYHNPLAAQQYIEDNHDHAQVRRFHQSLPNYAVTALIPLPKIAEELNVSEVYMKCESNRLGLKSFKILGAAWATVRAVCQRLHLPPESSLSSIAVEAQANNLILVTASQGNHGLAVSRMGTLLGLPVHVHLPADSSDVVADSLRAQGGTIMRCQGDYDVAVQIAASFAERSNYILVQDTAWDGYEEIPTWIVQGYATLMHEIQEQLRDVNPDLIVTPVGVGSLAEAVTRFCKSRPVPSRVLAVEPAAAGCLHQSLIQGKSVSIATRGTIMSGMNCGTVSSTAWKVLQNGVDYSITIPDSAAHERVEQLAQFGIEVGPCGAAAIAGLLVAAEQSEQSLGLQRDSTVVVLCTEGSRPYEYEGLHYPRATHAQDGQPDRRIILT